jgi:outer membrane receptor protein involved in Fe transport
MFRVKMDTRLVSAKLRWVMSVLVCSGVLSGQEASDEGSGEAVYELSPFEVSTSGDVGYLSTNSTSGTSLNTAIKDLPMSIQVVNQDFITDIAASNLEESLGYAAGVFTSDNQSSSSIGATRGTQGGGSGDRSISSGGKGERFANVVYIRGLSTPYQNRMGFRYGGLVVTPNSDIALGGLLDSANIERIEIVKGPNSLLYGVGVLTGIVNVIPEKPLAEPHYEVSFRAGSHDFLRTQVDITGPLASDWIPGQLNYRAAGSYETRGHHTAYRESETQYWTVQLDYTPVRWMNLFLEYQDGYNREDGIGAQWIYDGITGANDTEFRNAFDEAFNWARHEGIIPQLRPLDPEGFSTSYGTINEAGRRSDQPGFRLLDEPFRGGGRGEGFRITGPDTFAERDERNFIADLELYPLKGLTFNAGMFVAEQETRELNLQVNSLSVGDPNNFVQNVIPSDNQLKGIWESGGIYGVAMQEVVKELFGLTIQVDPAEHPGDYILPAIMDDVKLIEYWWRDSIVKSATKQYRIRATYTFDTDVLIGEASHTFLGGYSRIEDDVDFPDGSINRSNARANPNGKDASGNDEDRNYRGSRIGAAADLGSPVSDPYNKDGLYYRSIANFSPIYFDGRNDGVSGHNTVRAGDAYLNQVITQEGFYGVYQGKFFKDKLEVILGVRKDIYNATQLTYKRSDVADGFLRDMALAAVTGAAENTAFKLTGVKTGPEYEALRDEIIANQTADGRYIGTWYRDSFESGDSGYFGYADRGGAPDANFGVVPGSQFNIFEEDVRVTTFTAGANYDITPGLTVYGLLAQGVSPNTALRDGAGDIIPAEETYSRELGLKFELFEGKISGSIAVFNTERENAIWDVLYAPNASKWIDARLSTNRSNDWNAPSYDPASATSYYVRGDYLVDYIAQEFGVDPSKLSFAGVGNQIQQDVKATDLDPSIPFPQRLRLVQQIRDATKFPEEFATKWDSQAPFGGNVQLNFVSLNPEGFDDLMSVTIYNPDTNEFVTRQISNLPVIYAAFSDRELDFTKNSLLAGVSPIRYNRLDNFGQPQFNNNVDIARRALVTFDEEINGFEFEVFLMPTDNLQFVVNFTHVEREADNSFDFTEWRSIAGTEGTFLPPFSMLHREYGWENAGIRLAWVDYSAYSTARGASADGVVSLSALPSGSVEELAEEEIDAPIAPESFVQRSGAGQILVLVDQRGNVINEGNSALATDYANILTGVSLNFNPEDELSVFGKYTFSDGRLENLSLTAGFKYIGPSETSVAFNTVSPLVGLTVTPQLPERFQVDVGGSYRWSWNGWDMRLSVNVYNVFDETYDVNVTTLDTRNPITGAQTTKRTEKYYSPISARIGLSMSF